MKITIYTVSNCQFSKQEKDYLLSNNFQYEEKNLETNRDFLTEMLAVSNNFAGTPVTKIEKDDGQIAILKGFTKEEFDQALGLAPTVPQPQQTPPAAVPEPVQTTPTPPPAPTPSVTPTPSPESPIPAAPVFSPTADASQSMPNITQAPEAQTNTSAPSPLANDASLNKLIGDLEAKTPVAPVIPLATNPATATNLPNIPDFNAG